MADPSTDKAAAHLLDFIAGFESGGNYDAFYANAHSTDDLSKMTLDGIAAFQWALIHSRRFPSDATGRYQFMGYTLKSIRTQLHLTGKEQFTHALQDTLAIHLLVVRGYDNFLARKLSANSFADSIAHEWASLPLENGRSAYAGDGLNKALVSRAKIMEVLAETLALHEKG